MMKRNRYEALVAKRAITFVFLIGISFSAFSLEISVAAESVRNPILPYEPLVIKYVINNISSVPVYFSGFKLDSYPIEILIEFNGKKYQYEPPQQGSSGSDVLSLNPSEQYTATIVLAECWLVKPYKDPNSPPVLDEEEFICPQHFDEQPTMNGASAFQKPGKYAISLELTYWLDGDKPYEVRKSTKTKVISTVNIEVITPNSEQEAAIMLWRKGGIMLNGARSIGCRDADAFEQLRTLYGHTPHGQFLQFFEMLGPDRVHMPSAVEFARKAQREQAGEQLGLLVEQERKDRLNRSETFMSRFPDFPLADQLMAYMYTQYLGYHQDTDAERILNALKTRFPDSPAVRQTEWDKQLYKR